MMYLCQSHRANKRNGHATDYSIENLRTDYYSAFDADYFRRLLGWVAKQHPEVQVEGDIIRLTKYGFDNCERYDPTFQRDVEY